MEEQLINFETAKLAKKNRFKIPVRNFIDHHNIYNTNFTGHYEGFPLVNFNSKKEQPDIFLETTRYSAPTQALLQKWLREVYNLHVVVKRISYSGYTSLIVDLNIYKQNGFIKEEYINSIGFRGFEVYENALEKGLQEALKLIKLLK